MNRFVTSFLLVAAFAPSPSRAQTTIPVQATQVSLATVDDPVQASYLVLDLPTFAAPKQTRLEEAYLSFFMDVSSTQDDETSRGKRVTLEVYQYGGTTNGKLDVAHLGTSSMKRTVAVGSERSVRVYVTDFLIRAMTSGMSNQRLIVGSLSGDRVGVFDAKTLPGTANAKVMLTLYFTPISEASIDKQTGSE